MARAPAVLRPAAADSGPCLPGPARVRKAASSLMTPAPPQAGAGGTSPRTGAGGNGRRRGAQSILGSQAAEKRGRAEPETSYVTGRGRSRDGGGGPRHFRLPRRAGGAGRKPIGHRPPRGTPPTLPDAAAAILRAGRPPLRPGGRADEAGGRTSAPALAAGDACGAARVGPSGPG